MGTSICFGCGKYGHKVRGCPNIASREKEDKKVDPNVPKEDAPTRRHFYALRTTGEKPNKSDDDVGTSLSLSCCDMSSF